MTRARGVVAGGVGRGTGGRLGRALVLVLLLVAPGAAQEQDPEDLPEPPPDPSQERVREERSEADPSPAGSAPAPAQEPPATPWSAILSTRYRGRWGLAESDHDLTTSLTLVWGNPAADDWTLHVSALGAWDMDGVDGGGRDPFYSLQDTYDSSLFGRLHYAYLDLHAIDGLDVARLGRQLLYDTPVVLQLDGVRVESEPLAWSGETDTRVGGYLGVPVHPYESSPSGDLAGGTFVSTTPWKGARARVEWMHLEDEQRLGQRVDDLYGASLLQAIEGQTTTTEVELRHTRLDGDPRDVTVRGTFSHWPSAFALEVRYYELVETQSELSVPLDPFESTLLELFPFSQLTLLATTDLGAVLLDGGLDLREVSDEDDEGEFNRDFDRAFLTATVPDVLTPDLSLSLTGEVWDADGTDYDTWGVDLTRDSLEVLGGSLTASAGSYFSLYKYDLFEGEERDEIRTYYAWLRHRLASRPVTASLRYELENGDIDVFHRVTIGLTWRL